MRTILLVALALLLSPIARAEVVASQHQSDDPASQNSSQSSRQPTSEHSTRAPNTIKYVNKKYGFSFSLPPTWKGYKVVEGTWADANNAGPHGEALEHGPLITMVNPQSTSTKQYQDIYIMVFSHAQWKSIQQGELVVSAASVGPGELGRNSKYVFAEPPRMIDSDNLYGWEEVVEIMHGNPLHPF